MPAIATPSLPETSLLARLRGPECYRDAFRAEVPRQVTLAEYIGAFYASPAFLPERKILALIGRGANRADITALAEGSTDHFAAWSVEAREDDQILLRDFQDRTCSWLMVEPGDGTTRLWFGSGVRGSNSMAVKLLLPFHRLYARVLLAGAVRGLA
ncbi:hypothetical protein [Aurantiacibacter sp. D1-12]|uniref:hypothetical protein n=1 Tax=Aurantiacibacter sp. D1-12 TaxID=2993658 RepID=UPI00237CE104|nr:hypothetical protein [Aurantiacibacter sp. D1-12]MDE1467334.1 hypothetical protein [Aurantiacibacter sp. D1-12]